VAKGRKKGSPKIGGRKPGSKNKFTTEVRDAVMVAFDKLGGSAWLVRVAKENPAASSALLGKLLPHELATSGGALKHEVLLKWMTPEMAAARGLAQTALDDVGSVDRGVGTAR
jgi:hypothetical protein